MIFSFMFTIKDSSLFNSVVYADDQEPIERESKEYKAYQFELMTYANESWYEWGKMTGN